MPRIAFNHFGLTVADMDAALAFWVEGIGLHLLGRGRVQYPHLDEIIGLPGTDIEWAELALESGIVELFRYHSPLASQDAPVINAPGATHLAIEVPDIAAVHARLAALGYPTAAAAPTRIPFGDWEDWLCAYVREPNGVTVELLEKR